MTVQALDGHNNTCAPQEITVLFNMKMQRQQLAATLEALCLSTSWQELARISLICSSNGGNFADLQHSATVWNLKAHSISTLLFAVHAQAIASGSLGYPHLR